MRSGALKALLAVSFLWITTNPARVGGGGFGRIIQADSIIENRGGNVVVIPQDPQVGKLNFLLATNTHIKDPAAVADTFVRRSKSPVLLASMGMWETGPDCSKVSPKGARGPLQLMPEWTKTVKRYSAWNWDQNITLAEKVLRLKMAEHGGNLSEGVKGYCGVGSVAEEYRDNVLATYRKWPSI